MMPQGILKQGFTIHTPSMKIQIPRWTMVTLRSSRPTIFFHHLGIKLFKVKGRWYADVYNTVFKVLFDQERPPYPISYFK